MRAIRLLLVAMLFCSAGANADAPPSPATPMPETGTLEGAAYRIDIPA